MSGQSRQKHVIGVGGQDQAGTTLLALQVGEGSLDGNDEG